MLRLFTATNSSAVKNYFRASDYYSQGQEVVGRWGGELAAELGLSGTVSREAFDRLCDNRRPDGSKLTPRTNAFRRVGEDFIFSLPKEVGAFVMLLPDAERDELLAVVEQRVHQMMETIEADIETRVRKDGAFENRPGGGLAWAGFFHSTARPVGGQAPDPHPHWHMFAFNATKDDQENGRIKAADFATIYRDRPYYEALFFSAVAGDFAERGYALERRAGGKWGLAGLQAVGERFSKRTGEIEAEARRLDIDDPARKAELGAKTRSGKQKELTPDELREGWHAQLKPAEWDALDAVARKTLPPAHVVTAQEAAAFAVAHCSERLSVIPERELVRVALLHGLGSVTAEAIRRELPRQGVIFAERDGRLMATTKELQAEEDAIVRVARPGRGVAAVGVPDGFSRTLEGGKQLNDGQWQAVVSLLESPNRVNLIEGPAGAGKSSLLAKFDEAMRLRSRPVTYLATTAKAAEVLERDGFDAHTLQRFLRDEKMQQAVKGGHVVCDETSMLGHKDALELSRLARDLDLKLICVGDHLQHGSVPRGAFHKLLKDHAGLKPFQLSQIMRQRDEDYLTAAKLLSRGETLAGLDILDAKGWIKELGDGERYQVIASEYRDAIGQGQSVLCISPTHAEAARITGAIRSALRAAGKLGVEEWEFTRLVAADASEAERSQASTYRPGQVLQFFQNARGGFTKGDRLSITDPAAVPLTEAGRFQLYDTQTIALAEGDKVRFTATVKTLDGKHTLKNGTTRAVAGFDARGNIRLDNGWTVGKDAGHFRHAFVETSFGSQGQTVDRVLLAMGTASRAAMNQEQAYVSLTRGRAQASLYTDDKAAMRRAVQTSSQKLAALDLRTKPEGPKAEAAPPTLWHRLRSYRERLRRLTALGQTRAAWEPATRQAERRTAAMPPLPHRHVSFAGRERREGGYER